jgi:stage V sporulation protein S
LININVKIHEEHKMNSKKEENEAHVIKISAKTSPKSAAGSLATVLAEHGYAEMIAIGAASVNQAVKAIAIARGFVAPAGVDLVCVPAFETTTIEGNEKTRMRFKVSER